MSDFEPQVHLLTAAVLLLVSLFLFGFVVGWDRLWQGSLFGLALLVLVILILARFGGRLGPTL